MMDRRGMRGLSSWWKPKMWHVLAEQSSIRKSHAMPQRKECLWAGGIRFWDWGQQEVHWRRWSNASVCGQPNVDRPGQGKGVLKNSQIFADILYGWPPIIPSFTKCFEIIMAATLGKKLGPPMPKRSNDSYLRKAKSRRQHALFLWPIKLMLWISNLFLYLIEITRFQKHADGLLTDM